MNKWVQIGPGEWAHQLGTSQLHVCETGYASDRGTEYRVILFFGDAHANNAELHRVHCHTPLPACRKARELARAWFAARAKDAARL
jgi:hypothetical protein